MLRSAALCLLALCCATSLGCVSCANPWDYCGPVFQSGPCGDGCGNGCMVDERMGSAFTGGMGEYYDSEVYYDGMEYEGQSGPVMVDEPAPQSIDESPTSRDAGPPLREPTPADETPLEEMPKPDGGIQSPVDESAPPFEQPTGPPLELPSGPEGRQTNFTVPASVPSTSSEVSATMPTSKSGSASTEHKWRPVRPSGRSGQFRR